MSLRIRIGPFTFGKSGARLSVWKYGSGFSIPLSDKGGKAFGKISVGPVSKYFNEKTKKKAEFNLSTDEENAIETLISDEQLIYKLIKNGLPWRGLQESLYQALPQDIENRKQIAYELVPKTMNAVFGKQNIVWKTEKRRSKSGKGETTWIVII